MNNENLEQRLRNQPMRNVPADWREGILSATQAAVPRRTQNASRSSWLSTLIRQLLGALNPGESGSTLLWPSPKAWAGLAAAWIAIFAFNFSARDESRVLAMQSPPPSRAYVELLKEQRRELAELAGFSLPADIDKPKPNLPAPRSERRDDWSLT
jgi:hypothetical protein